MGVAIKRRFTAGHYIFIIISRLSLNAHWNALVILVSIWRLVLVVFTISKLTTSLFFASLVLMINRVSGKNLTVRPGTRCSSMLFVIAQAEIPYRYQHWLIIRYHLVSTAPKVKSSPMAPNGRLLRKLAIITPNLVLLAIRYFRSDLRRKTT